MEKKIDQEHIFHFVYIVMSFLLQHLYLQYKYLFLTVHWVNLGFQRGLGLGRIKHLKISGRFLQSLQDFLGSLSSINCLG